MGRLGWEREIGGTDGRERFKGGRDVKDGEGSTRGRDGRDGREGGMGGTSTGARDGSEECGGGRDGSEECGGWKGWERGMWGVGARNVGGGRDGSGECGWGGGGVGGMGVRNVGV